jgi:mannose-6-phosphate isomerase-like protein (cupin superfamily)
METIQKKTMNTPEEVRTFPKGKLELVTLNAITFGKATFEPGWKWSESVKPIAKTHSCQVPHTNYHLTGRLRIRMDDGTEKEFGPGDIGIIPPGHDAWVVGNEAVVVIDITGMAHYAEKK